jgi:hypothetical protein
MSPTLPHCPPTLDTWDLRLLTEFVNTQMPGWKWLIQSNVVDGNLINYFANVFKNHLSGRLERYPVYESTPERALSTAIRLALNAQAIHRASVEQRVS